MVPSLIGIQGICFKKKKKYKYPDEADDCGITRPTETLTHKNTAEYIYIITLYINVSLLFRHSFTETWHFKGMKNIYLGLMQLQLNKEEKKILHKLAFLPSQALLYVLRLLPDFFTPWFLSDL